MKKSLFFWLLSAALAGGSLSAQEIFEKNGKFGIGRYEEDPRPPVSAQYAGIVQQEFLSNTYYFFAIPNPKNPPKSGDKPFVNGQVVATVATGANAGQRWSDKFLYGFSVGSKYSEISPLKYASFYLPNDFESEVGAVLAYLPSASQNNPLVDIYPRKQPKKSVNGKTPFYYESVHPAVDQPSVGFVLSTRNDKNKGFWELQAGKKGSYRWVKVLPAKFTDIDVLEGDEQSDRLLIAKNSDKNSNVYTNKGALLLPFGFDTLVAMPNTRNQKLLVTAKKGGSTTLYDCSSPKCQQLQSFDAYSNTQYEQRPALILTQAGKQGLLAYLDETPQMIFPMLYDHISQQAGYWFLGKNQQLEVWQNNEKLQTIDADKLLVQNYNGTDNVERGGVAIVGKNSKFGLWDWQNQKMLLPTEYDKITYAASDEAFLVEQNGLKGLFLIKEKMLACPALFESAQLQKVPFSDGNGFSYLLKLKKNGKYGIARLGGTEFVIPTDYDYISDYNTRYQLFILTNYTNANRNSPNVGIADVRGKIVLPLEYASISEPVSERYLWVEKKSKIYAWDMQAKQLVPELKSAEILGVEAEKVWKIREFGELGTVDIGTWERKMLKNIKETFSLRWKRKIGITTYRTNMMLAGGSLVVASNGLSRDSISKDSLDGVYLLNPKNGNIQRQFRPLQKGDDDVNGVAVDGQNLYFAGDNKTLFAYTLKGEKRWELPLMGEVEGSPALADFNGDKFLDVVVAVESPAQIVVVDGKNGKKIWTNTPNTGGYFNATPALYDLNKDNIPEILIGLGGEPYFYAIDGKSGNTIWVYKTLSRRGFVDGSAVHASATVLLDKQKEPLIMVSECYGLIHFLDKNGKLKRYIGTNIGLFGSPVISPAKTVLNGTSWLNNGAVDVALTHSADAWKMDIRDSTFYIQDQKYLQTLPNFNQPVSSSGFVADILNTGRIQLGIADEIGKLALVDERTGAIAETLSLPAGVEAPIFVGDVDGDGKLELLVACLDGFVYCYATQAPTANLFWGQFRANNQNTGVLQMP